MTSFDNTWYHEIIRRYAPSDDADDDTPEAKALKCLAVANLASASIIAQAIDHLTDTIVTKVESEKSEYD